MDIEKVTQATKNLEPFPPDKRGFYHTIMSLIISQRIRFSKGLGRAFMKLLAIQPLMKL